MHYSGLTEYIYRLCVCVCVCIWGQGLVEKNVSDMASTYWKQLTFNMCRHTNTTKQIQRHRRRQTMHTHTRTARSSYTPVWGNAI